MIKSLKRYSGKGSANTAYSLSTDVGKKAKLDHVIVSYSAAPTQAGVTIVLDSGLGADYDATLYTGSANARYTILPLDYKPVIIFENDVITVTAPAGGSGITATITIVVEEL
jgi:hypothetical protein